MGLVRSQRPHDRNVLPRCARLETHPSPPLRTGSRTTSKLGRNIDIGRQVPPRSQGEGKSNGAEEARHARVSLVLPEAACSEACSLDGRNETDTGTPRKITAPRLRREGRTDEQAGRRIGIGAQREPSPAVQCESDNHDTAQDRDTESSHLATMNNRIFISWSGEDSHRIACILRDWLPTILPNCECWVSSEDIEKGMQWRTELDTHLKAAGIGIVCVVPGNLDKPWLNFEAGSLLRSVKTGQVCPFLFGVDGSVLQGPLSQFQATRFEREDVRKLVHSINDCCNFAIPPERLNRMFDMNWPSLHQGLLPLVRKLAENQ